LFDEDSFVPSAMIRGGKAYSILTDQLGTPTEAYDTEGNEVWSRVLDMDGNVIGETGNKGMVPFLFQGQYYDRETGLAYNRFRYYDPKASAYISQDPIRLAGSNLSIYGYVKDSNCMIDFWGLDTVYSRKKRDADGEEKPYVGSAKHGIKKRYTSKDLEGADGKDVFIGLDHDTSRGLEQIIFERGKTLKGDNYWANKYNPVSPAHTKRNKVYKDNMDKYTYRTEKAKEAMQQQYGDNWLTEIDEAFGF
ncbi:RHS repeat domain-containing protein, partial [Bacteroides thetaiotaomicron]|uniref:RHS repeat domain-containing protein n=1 Tax=Bacteroides thetaiotaomicron TaxID=818 RepID=UPI0034A4F14A